MRKRDRVHLGRMGMALLIAGCCLPWGQISAAAQPAMPEVLEAVSYTHLTLPTKA